MAAVHLSSSFLRHRIPKILNQKHFNVVIGKYLLTLSLYFLCCTMTPFKFYLLWRRTERKHFLLCHFFYVDFRAYFFSSFQLVCVFQVHQIGAIFSSLPMQNRSFNSQISAVFLYKNLKIVACLTTTWNCWLLSSFDLSLFTELLLQKKFIARYPPYYYVFHCSSPAKWSTSHLFLLNNNFFTLCLHRVRTILSFVFQQNLTGQLFGFFLFLNTIKILSESFHAYFEILEI